MTNLDFNPAYIGPRPEVEALVPTDAKLVLDVGCSNGTVGAAIKARTGARVFGIEMSEDMAADARSRIDRVYVGDAATLLAGEKLRSEKFDAIVFADVLEHLQDPWSVLAAATEHLQANGAVIISIPNVRHIDTLFNLIVRGHWPYRDRGIHDRSHLRFFTRKNIVELLEGAGLEIDVINTNYRVIERPHDWNRYAHMFAKVPGLKGFLAFQYVARAYRSSL